MIFLVHKPKTLAISALKHDHSGIEKSHKSQLSKNLNLKIGVETEKEKHRITKAE